MFINGVELQGTILILPLILLEVYVFALGLSLLLSAAFVKFRDINYIWEVVLQAGFYLTPILYAMSLIPSVQIQKILLLSPLAQAIQDARYAVVSKNPEVITPQRIFDGGWYIFIPFMIVLITLLIGVLYFKRESKYFAENI